MKHRKIETIVTGARAVDGAGVRLVRVIGNSTTREFDPFLMLDAFDSENPDDYVRGFPWHPHRGIETVTYLISGDIEHGDSLGNKGSILDGGCQWMTAGSGIIHQEMPKPSKRMLGLQLWLNLPAKDKMCEPKYRDLTAESIPIVAEPGARIAVIAGAFHGTAGAMRADYVPATMLDVAFEQGASLTVPVSPEDTAFAYVIDGAVGFAPGVPETVERRHAVLLSDGDTISLTAPGSSGARLVLFSGPPLREPIAWGGPIVMNTPDELELAFRELDDNAFIKHKGERAHGNDS